METSDIVADASRYLASTLHEIRTPIQTIIGNVELLKETKLDKEQSEYVRQIQFSSDILLELANTVLDFNKIRSNEFKLETVPFDICRLTEQVADMFSIEVFNRGMEFVTDIGKDVPPLVLGDPVRVQQIFLNLIKNAVKFTEKGYIHIELRRQDDFLLFSVTDTGIGISAENKARLFTDYYQSDISTYRKFGGTGLGLSICKNLVTVMNGEIDAGDNPDGGSVFKVKLPLLQVAKTFTRAEKPSVPKNQKILVVDDSVLAAKSLAAILSDAGFPQAEILTNGADALKEIQNADRAGSPFTLVFVDMIMPVMDGWRFASELKNSPGLKSKPHLFLTVPEGQMEKDAKMKRLNWFSQYIYKPFSRKTVRDIMTAFFERKDENLEELEGVADRQSPHAAQKKTEQIVKGKKILIAEDHPVNRKLMETFVRKFGAEVYLAADGSEAVRKIRETPDIALIFMDIQMPVKNGIDATLEIRETGYQGIIIACTANNDKNDFEAYKRNGINDIIVKPFKSGTIKAVLEKWNTILEIPNVTDIASIQIPEGGEDCLWNKDEFLESLDGDKNLAKEILGTFIKQTEDILTRAAKATERENYAELRKLAHLLKGSSGAIFAEKLAEYSAKLNAAAKKSDRNACLFYAAEFGREFERFKTAAEEL